MPLARELVSGNSGTEVQALLGSVAATFAAAGTTQATATAIAAASTTISSGAAFTGALLPDSMNPGDTLSVCNSTTSEKCIYPPVGYKLNGATANVPLVQGANSTNTFTCLDGHNYSVDAR